MEIQTVQPSVQPQTNTTNKATITKTLLANNKTFDVPIQSFRQELNF